MDWILTAKAALLLFLAGGVATIIVVYRRRLKIVDRGARPLRPDPNPFYLRRWYFTPTPLPDWAYDDDTGPEPPGESR